MNEDTITIEITARELSAIGSGLLVLASALSQEEPESPARDDLLETIMALVIRILPDKKAGSA